ncbi:FmdB family transcriptional regulator [Flavimobilis sp. GY10621]|uniref:FmdB family transcriptional regulator n=1 Tax=Flavimobilis rhizosphaerae TaxID=2775421 RepID=A0ABR9DM41_9MICO|nr:MULTISPECIES: FmdB family zinc ribbon protein [Micrococcales]MBD9698193.1 FmdB family transcriptional regulator [Flavimobilis rhizosphaerae]
MPTYAYTCTACGHSFDIHQSFADDALTVCPECSGRLRKIFSTVGVTFKGSGFYRTDSRSGSSSSVSTPAAKPAAKPASTSTSTGAA